MNVDYITNATLARRRDDEQESIGFAEIGTEKEVSDQEIDDALKRLDPDAFREHPGGSAFNTIHALAKLGLDLELGMIGVAGKCPSRRVSFETLLNDLGIDSQLVRFSDADAGRCVSYIREGERALLTSPGANREVVELLREEHAAVCEYLANARVVHITSLLDAAAPEILVDICRDVHSRSPHTLVSFDPGYTWALQKTAEIQELLELSSFLFLNYREFHLLGEYRDGEDDATVAERLFAECSERCELILLKKFDGVELFRIDTDRVLHDRISRVPLEVSAIQDATGAGDVFAAGVLAATTSAQMQGPLGVALGMALAREKLRHIGTDGHDRFGDLAESLLVRALGRLGDERLSGTLAFVDRVGSTDIARREGDAEAARRMANFKEFMRESLRQWRGREVDDAGDGLLIAFESPGVAVECVRYMRDRLRDEGLAVHAGLHTGPYLEAQDGKVSGLAVNAAARIAELAQANEILVSRTTRDLLADGAIRFEHYQRLIPKGFDEKWDVYIVMD